MVFKYAMATMSFVKLPSQTNYKSILHLMCQVKPQFCYHTFRFHLTLYPPIVSKFSNQSFTSNPPIFA